MRNVTYRTSGMHCNSCAMLITMNLEDLDGVERVECDYAKQVTTVTFDDMRIDDDRIRAAIVAAGYDADHVANS